MNIRVSVSRDGGTESRTERGKRGKKLKKKMRRAKEGEKVFQIQYYNPLRRKNSSLKFWKQTGGKYRWDSPAGNGRVRRYNKHFFIGLWPRRWL